MDLCEVPRWQQLKASLNNLGIEDFKSAIKNNPKAVCIDVRTSEEFKYNALEGAININYLSQNLADLLEALNREKVYFVYCRTSRRSMRVSVILKNMGMEVYHLENGIKDLF